MADNRRERGRPLIDGGIQQRDDMAVESWVPVAADSADDIVIKVESVGGSIVIQKALGLWWIPRLRYRRQRFCDEVEKL